MVSTKTSTRVGKATVLQQVAVDRVAQCGAVEKSRSTRSNGGEIPPTGAGQGGLERRRSRAAARQRQERREGQL